MKPILATLVLVAGCSSGDPLCNGVKGTCVSFPKSTVEAKIQTAFAAAKAGTTFVFDAGDFKFNSELTVTVDNVTIKGAGMDTTTLDFGIQTVGAEGILVMSSGFTIEDISVKDPVGNGIKVLGATGVNFERVHVLWSNPDGTKHGPYAVFPVQCKNVLVENSVIEGANDAGIYVGQSEKIIVRMNESKNNVAGVEIENSHFADVYMNNAHDNTAGILVFALPGLQQKDTHDVRVHDNMIIGNNTNNFASPGDIVEIVPRGTGTFVMGADNVEVFGNTYQDNRTANFAIIAYTDSGIMYSDDGYYPYTTRLYVHDNMFMGGGDDPDQSMGMVSIGGLLAISKANFPGGKDGDIMYDGVVDAMHTSVTGKNTMDICVGTNGNATFLNLHFDQLTAQGFVGADANITPYQCTLPPVDAVTL